MLCVLQIQAQQVQRAWKATPERYARDFLPGFGYDYCQPFPQQCTATWLLTSI